MINPRDQKLKKKQQQAQKANVKPRYRAVLCAQDGSRTAGTVWADENTKRVWFQFFGSGGVGRARCEKLEPELGLGVYVSKTDDELEWQVLEDDPFLRQTATDNRDYQSIAPRDLQPGGRLMLWLYSKLLVPLATYDTPNTLQVNVTSGDYVYNAQRKTFAGAIGQDLTSHVPGGGLTRYVGLYLDSNNSLQFVDGATSAIGSTPAEPTWPAGAFRLSVVQLDNGQTSIDFADDIQDRRLLFNDDTLAGGNVWPKPDKVNISTTEYSTIAAAIAALLASQQLIIGEGDFVCDGQTISVAAFLKGSGIDVSNLVGSTGSNPLTIAAAMILENLSISNSYVTTVTRGFRVTASDAVFRECKAVITSGASSRQGWYLNNVSVTLVDCEANVSGGSAPDAVYADVGGTSKIIGGVFTGRIYADTGTTLLLSGPTLLTASPIAGLGTVTGHYYDASGNLITVNASGMSGGVWRLRADNLRVKYDTFALANAAAASGDTIRLYPGTYSISAATLASGVNLEIMPGAILTSTDQYTLTCAGSNKVFGGGSVTKTGNTGTQSAAVRFTGNDSVVENISAYDNNSNGSAACMGFYKTNQTGIKLINCLGDATGATSTLTYGFRQDTSAGDVTIIGGQWSGDAADIYALGDTITVYDPILANSKTIGGNGNWAGEWDGAILVTNNSGALAAFGDVGYIDENGEYLTTTTANANVTWAVCVAPATDGNTMFMKRRGRVFVNYTGSAPSAGDFLVTSTTGGAAQQQTTIRPEIFAVCLAAGSGGRVDALLLTGRTLIPFSSSDNLFNIGNASASDFVATINGAPSGTSLTYNAPSSGNEDAIVPGASTNLAKILVWNTSKSPAQAAKISSVNTGTNVITVTAAGDISSWSNGETITTRSQTATDLTYYYDFEITSTEILDLAIGLVLFFHILDTGSANVVTQIHPYETGVSTKRQFHFTQAANVNFAAGGIQLPLLQRRFCLQWGASGTGTMTLTIRVFGIIVATP